MENMFGSKEDLRARCTYRSDLLAIILGNARFVYSFEDLRVIYEISNNSVKSVTDRQTNKLTKVGVEGQTVSPLATQQITLITPIIYVTKVGSNFLFIFLKNMFFQSR